MMARRSDVVNLIRLQLDNKTKAREGKIGGQWHYGTQELRELLDFIYGEPPKDDTEILLGNTKNGHLREGNKT